MPNSLVKNALGSDFMKNLSESDNSAPMAMDYENMSDDDRAIHEMIKQLEVCIKIIGCGGGGCNTINRCVDAGIDGAQLCAINTDAKHLLTVRAPKKILIGRNVTRGMGAGALPENGEAAARENDSDIRNFLTGAQIAFVTGRQGGGTGTGFRTLCSNYRQRAASCADYWCCYFPLQSGRNSTC